METQIYMVRHAHSTYTPDELNRPLSSQGEEAARKVAELTLLTRRMASTSGSSSPCLMFISLALTGLILLM